MAVTYTWDVENIELYDEYNGLEDVVFRVVWNCTATSDGGATKTQSGVIDLDLPTTSTGYVSIADLPRSQLVDWVKEKVAVQVIERGLIPSTKSVTFQGTTSTTVTVAEQLATNASQGPAPEPTPE